MDEMELSRAIRAYASTYGPFDQEGNPTSSATRDTGQLLLVLARIVEGKTLNKAFGAPGDWGYENPIGKALAKVKADRLL